MSRPHFIDLSDGAAEVFLGGHSASVCLDLPDSYMRLEPEDADRLAQALRSVAAESRRSRLGKAWWRFW